MYLRCEVSDCFSYFKLDNIIRVGQKNARLGIRIGLRHLLIRVSETPQAIAAVIWTQTDVSA